MPKLHLKRTPQEEADHKKRKRAKRARSGPEAEASSSRPPARKWDSSDSENEVYGPPPPEAGPSSEPSHSTHSDSRYKPDYEAIRAELEDARFRERMAEAFQDDDRLDSLETRMNEYAHVPDRWKTGRARADYDHAVAADDIFKLDPRYMDEEEYVEWMRAGMYRKTHAQEYAEEQQKKTARAARRAHEKALKAETARLSKIVDEERRRKKLEKEIRRLDYAREEYHSKWKELLAAPGESESVKPLLTFSDIPWPIASAHRQKKDASAVSPISLDDLTTEAIAAFLVPSTPPGPVINVDDRKHRKDKLRETFLRFHPDKFEGRLLKRVRQSDQEHVREAIGVVVRALNTLMGEDKG
ncbi:hypothetical protein B0H15DRAFT_1018789 [Mycena belliarum]|uniref:Uncharacterized protein n=1 Tax=Mycena belliarum TaxID=1033014 RepID=A0AAD6UFN1_9AGAR|nr:hypothetical protein B0H15DRAFT_1018789 [Mycena belliae]